MKRIIIGMIACICAITVMAQVQTHDVKGVVFDRRQQPIVGALVTAKRNQYQYNHRCRWQIPLAGGSSFGKESGRLHPSGWRPGKLT